MHLLLNHWTWQHQTLQVLHRSYNVEGMGYILCDLDPKVKGQILCFLVNASPLKLLDVAVGWKMTMDFAMDQCLQLDARQSHSLVADWIVK